MVRVLVKIALQCLELTQEIDPSYSNDLTQARVYLRMWLENHDHKKSESRSGKRAP